MLFRSRVLGNWRPCTHADAEQVMAALQRLLPPMLASDSIAEAAAEACGKLRLTDAAGALAQLASARPRADGARRSALEALDAIDSKEVDAVIAGITAEDPIELRKVAVRVAARRDPKKAVPVLASLCEKAELGERQAEIGRAHV